LQVTAKHKTQWLVVLMLGSTCAASRLVNATPADDDVWIPHVLVLCLVAAFMLPAGF
jgi:hypothetical protein